MRALLQERRWQNSQLVPAQGQPKGRSKAKGGKAKAGGEDDEANNYGSNTLFFGCKTRGMLF